MIANGLPNKVPQVQYIHTTATKFYPFDFHIVTPEQVGIYWYGDNGADEKLEYGVDYYVEDYERPDGGSIWLTPTALDRIPSGAKLTLLREPMYDQPMVFIENSALPARSLTAGLNHIVYQTQDLMMKLERAILVPHGYGKPPEYKELYDALQSVRNMGLGEDFCRIIYPNGTEAAPSIIAAREAVSVDTPTKKRHYLAYAEVLHDGKWGETFWQGSTWQGTTGLRVAQLGDQFIVQAGTDGVAGPSLYTGDPFQLAEPLTSAPFRLVVFTLKVK